MNKVKITTWINDCTDCEQCADELFDRVSEGTFWGQDYRFECTMCEDRVIDEGFISDGYDPFVEIPDWCPRLGKGGSK